jgi:hypothetical protein
MIAMGYKILINYNKRILEFTSFRMLSLQNHPRQFYLGIVENKHATSTFLN